MITRPSRLPWPVVPVHKYLDHLRNDDVPFPPDELHANATSVARSVDAHTRMWLWRIRSIEGLAYRGQRGFGYAFRA